MPKEEKVGIGPTKKKLDEFGRRVGPTRMSPSRRQYHKENDSMNNYRKAYVEESPQYGDIDLPAHGPMTTGFGRINLEEKKKSRN